MPMVDVQLVGPVAEADRRDLARRIADAAGEVFASPRGETWVTLHFVATEAYAENGDGPPAGVQPVVVSIVQANPPTGAMLAEQVARLTRAIAAACGRPPENVHLVYQPKAAGRVAFGGRLVE